MTQEQVHALAARRAEELTDWQARNAVELLWKIRQAERFWSNHVDGRIHPGAADKVAGLGRAHKQMRAVVDELLAVASEDGRRQVKLMLECGF